MKISLNLKLMTSFVVVVAITGIVATTIGVHSIGNRVVAQAQDKVREDLNSAREIYERNVMDVLAVIRLTANRFFISDRLLRNEREELSKELERIRLAEVLDMLTLVKADGTVFVRARNPGLYGDLQSHDRLIGRVMKEKRAMASTEIMVRRELEKEGVGLADQAYMEIIPTPKAVPVAKSEETAGMVIRAAAPVLTEDDHLIGVLCGGILLNRNYAIVDKIKNTVYQDQKYEGRDIGTATIFQGDLRISTNVMDEEGRRAIGTRVSAEVYDHVLVQGRPWFARAFVVNDWYITAYEPIRDLTGKAIGMLYVGILEKKYADVKRSTLWLFMSVALTGMGVAITVSYFLARGITNPIGRLVAATKRVANGVLDQRIESVSKDEIGELSKAFNFMVNSIRQRDERLKEQAELEIMKSEKLAMIGRLAAGVAHEINNPLGGILMYSHLTLEGLSQDDPRREDLEKIVKETNRCKKIVRGLLDFARPSEPDVEMGRVEDVLESVLLLVEKQALFQSISIERDYSPDIPMIPLDRSQMQQVFMNIILNAAESMAGNGRLSVGTRFSEDGKRVQVRFSDTGHGIPQQNIEKLFEPFFTTKKPGEGTGLGLSISHGIVRKHGGRIRVESEVGKGTTFSVELPVKGEGSKGESV